MLTSLYVRDQLLLLPAGIDPFKVITIKVEHYTNVFMPNIEQAEMETKGSSKLIVSKQKACITQEGRKSETFSNKCFSCTCECFLDSY